MKRSGDEEHQQVIIAVDKPGSMQTSVLHYIADMVGDEDELVIRWVCFDSECYPFQPGDIWD